MRSSWHELRIFEVVTEKGLTFRYRFSIWNYGPVPIL